MNNNSLLTILLLCLPLVSCGQTTTNKATDKNEQQNQALNNYPKITADPTNKLISKVESIEVEYTVWGCACPNWIQTKDNNNDTTKTYIKRHFYIEPADKTLELPKHFDAFKHKIRLRGQFYEKEDYPKGALETEEPMPKAKVFRYTKMQVINKLNTNP